MHLLGPAVQGQRLERSSGPNIPNHIGGKQRLSERDLTGRKLHERKLLLFQTSQFEACNRWKKWGSDWDYSFLNVFFSGLKV